MLSKQITIFLLALQMLFKRLNEWILQKTVLVIKLLFLINTWITFGKELMVTQLKKLREDGRGN